MIFSDLDMSQKGALVDMDISQIPDLGLFWAILYVPLIYEIDSSMKSK